MQDPVGRNYLTALWIELRRFQPEAEAERSLGCAAQLSPPLAPGIEQPHQVAALRHLHLNAPVVAPQSRPPRAGNASRRFAPPVQAGSAPVAHGPVNQPLEKAIQQRLWRVGLVSAGPACPEPSRGEPCRRRWHFVLGEQRPAHRRHGLYQGTQTRLVVGIVHHR